MTHPSRLHHILKIITATGNHNSLRGSRFFPQNHKDENMTRYQIAIIPLRPKEISESTTEYFTNGNPKKLPLSTFPGPSPQKKTTPRSCPGISPSIENELLPVKKETKQPERD
jgi:hypothetical protein